MADGVQLGGGPLLLAPSITLAFNGTVVSPDGADTIVGTGSQSGISGILTIPEESFNIQGGNGTIAFAPIAGGGAMVLTGIGTANQTITHTSLAASDSYGTHTVVAGTITLTTSSIGTLGT